MRSPSWSGQGTARPGPSVWRRPRSCQDLRGGGDIASSGFRPWALAPSPSQPGLGLEPGTFPVESIRRGPTLLGPEERSWGFSICLSGHELPGLGPDRGGGLREALLTVCCSSCIPLPAHRGPFPSWQAAPAAALAPAPAKPADAPPARRVSVRGLLWECGVWAGCEQGAQSSAGRSRTVTKLPGNPHPRPPHQEGIHNQRWNHLPDGRDPGAH